MRAFRHTNQISLAALPLAREIEEQRDRRRLLAAPCLVHGHAAEAVQHVGARAARHELPHRVYHPLRRRHVQQAAALLHDRRLEAREEAVERPRREPALVHRTTRSGVAATAHWREGDAHIVRRVRRQQAQGRLSCRTRACSLCAAADGAVVPPRHRGTGGAAGRLMPRDTILPPAQQQQRRRLVLLKKRPRERAPPSAVARAGVGVRLQQHLHDGRVLVLHRSVEDGCTASVTRRVGAAR
eukprot:6393033-Prymnesium_polylepis.1